MVLFFVCVPRNCDIIPLKDSSPLFASVRMASSRAEKRKLLVESRHKRMSMVGLFRKRAENDEEEADERVTFVELFYDLVFVFSIVQLSHAVSSEYTWLGVAQASLMILAVWWEWIFTTWAMNWIHPESAPGRAMLFSLTLVCLIESSAIPKAFGSRGWAFGLAHVTTQVGRSLSMSIMMRSDDVKSVNFARITCWLGLAAPFWMLGAAHKQFRLVWWTVGLFIEYAGPMFGFWMPFGISYSRAQEWDVLGGHIAERVASFVIICLGESLTIAGEIVSRKHKPGIDVNAAFLVSFGTSLSLWWTYFRFTHKQAAAHIELSDNPGHVARLVYTYVHIPIVAGIIFSAVATRFLLDDPNKLATPDLAAANVGGPAIYLCGTLFSKAVISGHFMLSHVAGAAALILLYLVLLFFQTTLLHLAVLVLLVLLLVAVSEQHLEHRSSYTHACKCVYSNRTAQDDDQEPLGRSSSALSDADTPQPPEEV